MKTLTKNVRQTVSLPLLWAGHSLKSIFRLAYQSGKLTVCRTLAVALLFMASNFVSAQDIPATDRRATEVRHLDLPYTFTAPNTKEAWLTRAQQLRYQVLTSAGLWSLPEKTPLNARVFDKTDRGDYTVEKVYFESTPGHYVTGNLYRPKNITGKVPAVLSPHGHWAYGRLENSALGSVVLRAVNFAKLGFVVFTWDMVGYNDSAAISHQFASHKESLIRESLWGVNLLGLQLWNSLRAVDFIESLPEVDRDRIGCTGASGGGTQTFLLTAVDDRIKVSAPVNMLSFIMQGGSLCENAPNLRIDTNNVELGATMAPRPMLMVSATGDWTKNTLKDEYPAIRSVYRLFGAEDKLHAIQIDAPHNYNQQSREAVYGWFAKWLQGRGDGSPIKEKTSSVPPLNQLMVFFSQPRPANELDEKRLSESLIATRQKQFEAALPRNETELESFRKQYGEALKYSLMVEYPKPEAVEAAEIQSLSAEIKTVSKESGLKHYQLTRPGQNDGVRVTAPSRAIPTRNNQIVIFIGAADLEDLYSSWYALQTKMKPAPPFVFVWKDVTDKKPGNVSKFQFIDTYNRSLPAQRVQALLTTIAWIRKQYGDVHLNVVGLQEDGLTALLARSLAPQIDRVLVDATQFDNTSDEEFLKRLPIPNLRRAGDFTTAVALAPKTPLLIHNTGNRFQTERIRQLYQRLGKESDLKVSAQKLSDEEIIRWLKEK